MVATRREVALAASVSLRTVSNVVNGFPGVAPETRERVLKIINDLDYRPSEIARMLKRGRSGLIALVLPELDTPYFAELTRAFVELGAARGFTVVIDQTDGDASRERELISQTDRGAFFDGLIVSPLGLQAEDLAGISPERPVVFLGEDRHARFDQVMIDNFSAARAAVDHLISLGRTRIGVIGAQNAHLASSSVRLAAYERSLLEAGLPVERSRIAYVDSFRRADGATAMAQLLETELLDGIFCFSDPLALGAIRILHERGIRIPDDIAVIGFDDIEDGRFSWPTLSSVSPDKRFIATRALDLLSARLDGAHVPPATYLAPWSIVTRESTAGSVAASAR